MSQQITFPLSVNEYEDRAYVVDANGFIVADISSFCILDGYAEKLGLNHWAEAPGKSYIELKGEEPHEFAHLVVRAVNSHAACAEALDAALTYLSDLSPIGSGEITGQLAAAWMLANGETP